MSARKFPGRPRPYKNPGKPPPSPRGSPARSHTPNGKQEWENEKTQGSPHRDYKINFAPKRARTADVFPFEGKPQEVLRTHMPRFLNDTMSVFGIRAHVVQPRLA